jgi:hypothetical protein
MMVQPHEISEMPEEFREAIRESLEPREVQTPVADQVRLLESQSVEVAQLLGEVLATLRLPQNRVAIEESQEHREGLWRMVDRWYERARPWLPKGP